MANTYTQIYVQTIFAVKNRNSFIHEDWRQDLYNYIFGIIERQKHKAIAINGIEDHIHVFLGLKPNQSISDLLRDIKANSSKWINDRKILKGRFEWQEGYGAFSYSKSQIPRVITYIQNQEAHHKKKSFLEEYRDFLQKFEIDFKEEYLFKEPS